MYTGLVHAHSGLRWIVLVLIVLAVIKAAGGLSGNKSFDGVRKLGLFALIATHIQFVIGLVLYFLSPKVQFVAETMGDSVLRFYAMEHLVTMLIAVVLITVGYSRSKRGLTDVSKYKSLFWFYLIGLVIMLSGIPWPFRDLGAGWF